MKKSKEQQLNKLLATFSHEQSYLLLSLMKEVSKLFVIKWKIYPAYKPKKDGHYLVTIKEYTGELRTDIDSFSQGDWYVYNADRDDGQIIAFANSPDPYLPFGYTKSMNILNV